MIRHPPTFFGVCPHCRSALVEDGIFIWCEGDGGERYYNNCCYGFDAWAKDHRYGGNLIRLADVLRQREEVRG
jgi:hypothetical protein